MPFRTRGVSVALATVAALACWPPGAAAADARPGWAAAPAPGAGSRPTGTDRPFFYLEGAPGTVLTDRLAVTNPAGHPVTVRLRGAPAEGGTDASAWLAPAVARVRVPARTRAAVPFTVTVPRDAGPGERTAALRADGPGGGRTVPVHLRVTGPALAALTVEGVAVARRGGAAEIRYTLVNRGTTVLRPRLAVRADGVLGTALRHPARALPVVLAPGQRVRRTETWSDPPALDAVDVTLTVTAAGGAHASARAGYAPLSRGALGAGALAVVAGAGGALWRRRRRAGRTAPQEQPAPAVRELIRVGDRP
ncbi:COG1470 family protein [Streptomyces benahoarensis]|uniref:DUF916 domain-containing protein n=1 Tax=Streptomyces benahoarensis TaxID=2595054 RepID=A0A553ZP47_9ACTN|nr:hypothetical protein [Streptomyces benahoarensis]TSB22196.1 hypothetical protein FNJ62_16685 [Streptomyces benahoarensis]TSB43237.1 hypothetical protein FNZ23_05710 [Streptomyces benahoarensis]